MQLKIFKTLWGYKGTAPEAAAAAKQQGYDGIEGPVPSTAEGVRELVDCLDHHGLDYIAEVATTGTFIPDRSLPPEAHLDDLHENLERLVPLRPLFVTCLGGCDSWPLGITVRFFQRAVELSEACGFAICFETHRGRSLFNPWVTRTVLDILPKLQLTCDFSHWCVVCEGLQSTEETMIHGFAANAGHVHGRVGYDQGAQIPHPGAPGYEPELLQHLKWWRWIWQRHYESERNFTTVTPEFGPDGYDYRDPVTRAPLMDLEELNGWMMQRLRSEFSDFINSGDGSAQTSTVTQER